MRATRGLSLVLAGIAWAADPAPAAPAAAAKSTPDDLIILANRQRIVGRIDEAQSDPDRIAIATASGTIKIRRGLVATVDLGLASRLASVKPGDLDGLIDTARWCRAKGHLVEALDLLAKAVALPGCDLDTRALYIRMVDERDGPEKALPLYIDYERRGGKDAEMLKRLAELRAVQAAYENLGLPVGTGATAVAGSTPPATAASLSEGLETRPWASENPKWANPAEPQLISITTPDGPKRVLQFNYKPSEADPKLDKAAIVLRRPYAVTDEAPVLSFAVNNPNPASVAIAIAVKTGNDWRFFESKAVEVVPAKADGEFATLKFDLSTAGFKSAGTNWSYAGPVEGLSEIKEVQILLMNGRTAGSVLISGIGFTGR